MLLNQSSCVVGLGLGVDVTQFKDLHLAGGVAEDVEEVIKAGTRLAITCVTQGGQFIVPAPSFHHQSKEGILPEGALSGAGSATAAPIQALAMRCGERMNIYDFNFLTGARDAYDDVAYLLTPYVEDDQEPEIHIFGCVGELFVVDFLLTALRSQEFQGLILPENMFVHTHAISTLTDSGKDYIEGISNNLGLTVVSDEPTLVTDAMKAIEEAQAELDAAEADEEEDI